MSTADNRLRVWDETIRLQVAYRFVSFERWCWGTLFDLCNDFIWTYVAICKAEWSPAIIATNDVKCHYLQISIENIRKLRKKIILIAPHLDWTILSRVTYSINESEITDLWKLSPPFTKVKHVDLLVCLWWWDWKHRGTVCHLVGSRHRSAFELIVPLSTTKRRSLWRK